MAMATRSTKYKKTKTYIFRVVLEEDRWPDEPKSAAVWRAYVPSLESQGAATWGETREEALKNIQEVMELIIDELIEEGKFSLSKLNDEVTVLEGPAISVNR